MKTYSMIAAVLGVLMGSWLAVPARAADPASKDGGTEAGKGALYHVVSLKFKDSAKPEQIKAVEQAFVALKEKIPGIMTMNWGTNVSPESHSKGFTHCFVLTFSCDKDRDEYLVHQAHKDFGKGLGPILGEVMVLDFWSKQ